MNTMFEIDKQKFGKFIAVLRKEKGYTQKELAQRLFISDKAVSKWETATSIPDTALLVPLADLLGVSVTELLMCERVQTETHMDTDTVESLVKTAIHYSETNPPRAYQEKSKWSVFYILSLLIGCASLLYCYLRSCMTDTILCAVLMCAGFGAYFVFFVRTKLPTYYDENRITAFNDGPIRINLPGVAFNSANWPYIVLAGRIWACVSMAAYPFLALLLITFTPTLWADWEDVVFLVTLLGGLFVPMYMVGKKYQ